MSFIKDPNGKRSPSPSERPAPKNRNVPSKHAKVRVVRPSAERPAPANRQKSGTPPPDLQALQGKHYHGPHNPLVLAFDSKFQAKQGHSLRQYGNMSAALLESGVASAKDIQQVLAKHATRPGRREPNQWLSKEINNLLNATRTKVDPVADANARLYGGGVSPSIQAAYSRDLAREQQQGTTEDPLAEAVIGGVAGGAVAGLGKAFAKTAAERAAGGLLTGDALKSAPEALSFTTPTKGLARYVMPKRPTLAKPLAQFAGRSAAHRVAVGSGILAAAPAANTIAGVAAKKAAGIRGHVHVEVDPSELNPVGQAYAEGRKPTQQEIKASGLKKGAGRVGLSPSLRARLLRQAHANGWELPLSTNDTELIAKAYKRNSTIAQRLTAGLVENVGNAAMAPATAGALFDATKQSLNGGGATPFVKIGQGMADSIANAAEHPIDNPLFAAGIYSGIAHGVGSASAKALRVKPRPLTFQVGDVGGKPFTWQYGTAKPNTLTLPAHVAAQAVIRRSPKLQDTIMGQQSSKAVQTITARAKSRGAASTHDLAKALNRLGKKEQILAVHAHLTGSTASRQAAYYAKKLSGVEKRKAAGKTVDAVALRSLKAKAMEWQQLADVESKLTPKQRERINEFKAEAHNVEQRNQQILADFGMSPDVMDQRLWMQAIQQHPHLKSTIEAAVKANKPNLAAPLEGAFPSKKQINQQARTDAEGLVRGALTHEGNAPVMYVPQSPVDAGPSNFISPSNPFLTGGRDRMSRRFMQNTGDTLRQGLVDERPSLTIHAAAKPSEVASLVDDMERFLQQRATPLHVQTDRGMTIDPRFTIIKASKDGKLKRGAIMRRAKDQARLLEEAGLGDRATINDLTSTIFDVVQPKDGRIPPGSYYAIPTAARDQIIQDAAIEARRNAQVTNLRKASKVTTGLMINTLPRTMVNNAGGLAMSTLGGAGPLAHLRVLRDERAKALVPPELRGRGLSGSQTGAIAAKEGNALLRPIRTHQNRMRRGNVFIEDLPRGALAVNNLLKTAKQIQHGSRINAAMHRVSDETYKIAQGLYDTHPDLYEKAVRHAIDWTGDLGYISKLDPAFQLAAPFWRWNKQVLKALLYTMPAKYPLRATLIQALGEVGREYQREHGIWPSWLQGAIDVGDLPLIGGKAGEVTNAINTSGFWPYATAAGVLQSDYDNAAYDPKAALSIASPLVKLPVAALFGKNVDSGLADFKDQNGNPVEFGSPEWKRMLAAQALSLIPTPYSKSGQTDTSLPWDAQYKQNGLPRRGNSPLEIGMRAFGIGTTPVQIGGPGMKEQGAKAFKRATATFSHLPPAVQKEMLHSWRQNDDGSHSIIIDLGRGH